MSFKPSAILVPVALLLCLAAPAPAEANEYYFVLLFSAQTTPTKTRYSHTFATFVRAVGTGPRLDTYDLYWHTISWLPVDMKVRTWTFLPECGHNFDLHTTLRGVLANGARVSLWGPYQVEPRVYWNAVGQKANLESGRMHYKAVDIAFPARRVADCIHAVSRVVFPERINLIDPLYGEPATYFVLRQYRPYIIDECTRHYSLVPRLGLSCYPIIYRDMERPRSGPIHGPISSLFGTQPPAVPSYGPPVGSYLP
jgi:hypothetical protein